MLFGLFELLISISPKGKLAKIRKGVSIIQEELIKTKLECAEWQRRYQSLICETYVQIFFQV
jgi:hypothetical protein